MEFETLLWAVGLAAAAAAVPPLVIAAHPGWRKGRAGTVAGTIGLGAGYLAAHWVEAGPPAIPPLEVVGWTFWFAAAAAALAVVEAFSPPSARGRWPVRILLAVTLPLCFINPLFESGWTTARGAAWIGALGLGLFLWWTLLDRLSGRSPGVPELAVLCATAGGSGVAMLLSGSKVLGELGAAFAASLATGAAIALILRRPSMAGSAGVVAIVLAALLINAHLYAELRALPALLAVLAPLAGLGTKRSLGGKTGPFRAACAGVTASLLLLAAAVAIALHDSPPF